jgi:hypothetical protein
MNTNVITGVPAQGRYLSIRQFGRTYGYSDSTTRRRVDDGSLPVLRLGATVRIDTQRWLESQQGAVPK